MNSEIPNAIMNRRRLLRAVPFLLLGGAGVALAVPAKNVPGTRTEHTHRHCGCHHHHHAHTWCCGGREYYCCGHD